MKVLDETGTYTAIPIIARLSRTPNQKIFLREIRVRAGKVGTARDVHLCGLDYREATVLTRVEAWKTKISIPEVFPFQDSEQKTHYRCVRFTLCNIPFNLTILSSSSLV